MLNEEVHQENVLPKNLPTRHTVIWEQITQSLQNRIKSHHSCAEVDDAHDAVVLLKLLVSTCNAASSIDHHKSKMVDVLHSLPSFSGNQVPLGECCEHFQERVQAAPALGVNFATEPPKRHLLSVFKGERSETDHNERKEEDAPAAGASEDTATSDAAQQQKS